MDGAVEIIESLSADPLGASAQLTSQLQLLIVPINALPDRSAERDSRSYLSIAEERWRRVRNARSARAKAAATQSKAQTVYETYCEVADEALNTLYRTVEDDFARQRLRVVQGIAVAYRESVVVPSFHE